MNPAKATESNLAGIAHVVPMMDWYCNLTDIIFKQENIKVGKESFEFIQQKLENRTVVLYKALLLYQMKSACSFYRHQGLVYLRGLVNLDNWDASLKSIRDAEVALQKDLDQFYQEHTKASMRCLIETAQSQEALLGDIRQMFRDSLIQQQEMHNNEKDMQCLKDLCPTDPRDDKSRIQQTKGGLLEDSYRWILSNSDFLRWRHGESSLLWIKGDPGKGKTMLLCGIIDELSPISKLDDRRQSTLLSYFFCQATDARINNATAVLRGLIYLLVKQQPSLIAHVRESYEDAGKRVFEDTNSWFALSRIFTAILRDPALQSAYLAIDGLDECVTDRPLLLNLLAQSSSLSRIRWIVSSRNWPDIERRLDTTEHKVQLCLELNHESISAAVGNYIQHKVDQLAQLMKYDDKTRDAVHRHLSLNANDTFLWVALVCQNLEKVPRWKVLAKVQSNEFPLGLDSLYQRMMDQLGHSDEVDLCRRILTVVSAVYRPITLEELPSFVDLPDGVAEDEEFWVDIIGLCGSFLFLRERTVRFVHQSAQDFLSADMSLFPSGMTDVHYSIFSRSLLAMSKSLRRNIYCLPSPGFPIESVQQPKSDPLAAVRYSCVFWLDHLHDCNPSRTAIIDLQDGGSVDKFLRRSYLYWLEALSLLKSMSEGILSMKKLDAILQVRQIHQHLKSY
jgi:hypothetical protein